MGLIEDFFIRPIIERSGYNPVNTIAYAIIAIVSLYFIYQAFKREKINIDRHFWAGALSFVLFGSSVRVVTDAIDSGAFQSFALAHPTHIASPVYLEILRLGFLDYGFWTVTPGMYVVTAALFLSSFWIGRVLGKKWFAPAIGLGGAVAWLSLLFPLMVNWAYGAAIVLLAASVILVMKVFAKWEGMERLLPVFAHSLDGAATWIAIDWFGPATGRQYFEQHVLSKFVGGTELGYALFFAVKVALSIIIVRFIFREKELGRNEASLLLLAIVIIGLAPGIRDLLRLLAGV